MSPNDFLIWNPDVFAVGQTKWNVDPFNDWMSHNYLDEHRAFDTNTPLARLWNDVSREDSIERMIEFGGRHCYRAWEQGRDRADYIANIIEMGHGSVLEHATINWAIQGVSRSLSLELARHRVGIALSQESQRYVDAKDVQFVVPPMLIWLQGGCIGKKPFSVDFHNQCLKSLEQYTKLQQRIVDSIKIKSPHTKSLTMIKKRANEAARAHLPNACETRFLWTTNMRLLRHFLWLRGGSGADLEIRRLAVELLHQAQHIAPSVFNDMTTQSIDDGYGVPIIVAAA